MTEDYLLNAIQNRIGIEFKNPQLLLQALTHKSFAIENDMELHYEKLELLGDALLDFLILEYLMQTYSSDSEGQLSKKRASLVNQALLDTIARELELYQYIRLSRAESKSGGAQKASILAAVVEAILGALYVDQGLESCRKLISILFGARIHQQELFKLDFKTELQEKIQGKYRKTPVYKELSSEVTAEKASKRTKEGPVVRLKDRSRGSHLKTQFATGSLLESEAVARPKSKKEFKPRASDLVKTELGSTVNEGEFRVGVFVDEQLWAEGRGRSKKEAEQKAAARALEKFNNGF